MVVVKQHHTIKKKFYRDFTEREIDMLDELQDYMAKCYVFVPPFVIKKMIERGILPNDLDVIDENMEFVKENIGRLNDVPEYRHVVNTVSEGIPYEFSNEGVSNPISPYRLVFASEYDGHTYFVKVSVPPARRGVRIIDVWRKKGEVPISPPREQRNIFAQGVNWDISHILARLVDSARFEVD